MVNKEKTLFMKIAVVSGSLSPKSRSRVVARLVADSFAREAEVEVDWIDLQELALPLCDGGAAYGDANAVAANERLDAADAVVLAGPIYNYDFGAALKNLIELAGRKMEGKLVGVLCAAGGTMSYMSPMAFIGSLMLDFRVIVLPRFVYVTGADFEGEALKPEIAGRVEQFEADFLALARKLAV